MAEFDSSNAESCGLYIDVENLQIDAQELVGSLIGNWPSEKAPRPTKMILYVKADMVELWNAWTVNLSGGIQVEVKGIQHFTVQQSKNSADIAIALDAVTDLVNRRVNFVAVLSDDSDFISLFAKVRTETAEIQTRLGRIPFLWIMTDRDGTKTPNIRRIYNVSFPRNTFISSRDHRNMQPCQFQQNLMGPNPPPTIIPLLCRRPGKN